MFDRLTPEAEAILSDITAYHRANLRSATRAAAIRKRNAPTLNLIRMFTDLSRGHVSGEDREALQEYARRDGVEYSDLQKPYLPFRELRDLNKSVVGAGGYLVSSETTEPVDILRPYSVSARLGMMVETGLVGDQLIPKVSAKSTPYWLSTETASVTASQTTLQQVACVAKQVGIVINFSRHLSKQANAELFIRRELMRTVGTAIDQAVINGTGASGQPLGLLNTSGVQTQSGTTLNTGVLTMKKLSAEANVDDQAISFLSTPAVRALLEARAREVGGGRFVWDKDQVADRPAAVSTDVPTATMICGDWSNVYLGQLGAGFTVEINPYDTSGFKAGIISARIIVTCDVAVLQPAGFVVATSIT